MGIRSIRKSLEQFRQSISDDITVEEMIVFGSYGENAASEESDIDVIVLSNDFKTMKEDQRLDLLYSKSIHIRPIIHPWGFTAEELASKSHLTFIGDAREKGIRFK